jgi:hypothetical protein
MLLDARSETPPVVKANKAMRSALVAAVSSDSSAADFQAALATTVPLLLPVITNSADRAELMLLIGRLLSNVYEEAEGELRSSLSWLETSNQELHREMSQKMKPLEQRLVDLKAAVADKYGVSASETRHWDKPFFEVRILCSTHVKFHLLSTE